MLPVLCSTGLELQPFFFLQGKQLNMLSKDFDNSDISATEFVINGSQLHFLAADEGLNLRLFKYDNKNPQSWKGQKLLPL